MKKLKTKIQIIQLKNNALKLRANGQLPFALTKAIYNLNDNDSEDYLRLLMQYSKHYLRIKGYYNMYKDAEKQASCDIRKGFLDKGYKLD